MFLVSGLFVLPGLRRKGALRYARDRIWRLGLPFAACVTLIMPLAYYPFVRQTGADLSLGRFRLGSFTTYGWPAGPAWFIWVLLALDLLCSALIWRWPNLPAKAAVVPDPVLAHPVRNSLLLLAAGFAAYLPVEALVGPWRWFSLGPFAAQKSRVGLYALFFVAGTVVGAAGIHYRLLTRDGPFARGWVGCAALAAAAFGLLVTMQLAKLHHLMPWAGSRGKRSSRSSSCCAACRPAWP